MGTTNEITNRPMTALEKTSRFSLVSSLVLYAFALLFSYLTGARVRLALQRRDDAFNGGGERLTVLLVLEVDGDVLAEDGVEDVVADTLEERGPAHDGTLLGVLHQEEVTLVVAFLQGGVPGFEHFVAERERVLLEHELADGDDVDVVASLGLEILQRLADGAGGRTGEDAGVIDDVARGGRGV